MSKGGNNLPIPKSIKDVDFDRLNRMWGGNVIFSMSDNEQKPDNGVPAIYQEVFNLDPGYGTGGDRPPIGASSITKPIPSAYRSQAETVRYADAVCRSFLAHEDSKLVCIHCKMEQASNDLESSNHTIGCVVAEAYLLLRKVHAQP